MMTAGNKRLNSERRDYSAKHCLPFLLMRVGISFAHCEHGVEHQHALLAPALQVPVRGLCDVHLGIVLQRWDATSN
jgi:hypothetical protein